MGSITRSFANLITSDGPSAVANDAVTAGDISGNLNFRNIIINGDMSIAQRTTSAVTINSGTIQFGIDRFGARGMSSAGVFTTEQSTDAPTNFVNSFKATVTTADSSIASDATYRVVQHIEGNMIKNLNWGSAQAQSVTLSFKVKSSLTGTFGGAIINGDYNRFYNFSYTISTADTWTDISVTIPGDTSGTWVTNQNLGIRLSLSLGAGSGEVGSAGSWGTSSYEGVTGQTNLIATNGATWQITGVQLEAGTTASDFEFLPHDVNLNRCLRYFFSVDYANNGSGSMTYAGSRQQFADVTGYRSQNIEYPKPLRENPTITFFNGANNNTSGQFQLFNQDGSTQNFNGFVQNNETGFFFAGYTGVSVGSTGGTTNVSGVLWTADAEL